MIDWFIKLITKCICWGYVEWMARELKSIDKSDLPPSVKRVLKTHLQLTLLSFPLYLIRQGKGMPSFESMCSNEEKPQ